MCASVPLVRTKKGDFSTTAVVLEIMITVGFCASVSSGAPGQQIRRQAAADDVDLVVDDEFLDQPLSGLAGRGVVPDDQLDLLPATVSPCCFM